MKSKKLFLILLAGSLFLFSTEVTASNGFSSCTTPCNVNKKSIKRTYVHPTKYRYKTVAKSKNSNNETVEITYQELLNHLTVGNTRDLLTLNAAMMDVKNIDDNGTAWQTWTMPNFNNFTTEKYSIEQVALNSNNLIESFPNVTHLAKTLVNNRFDAYELTENELFYYGYGAATNGVVDKAVDYYSTLAPLPLKWGLGYTGIVTFIYDEDPQIDYTEYVQHYDVVAKGTLKTFDDGDVDAVKAIFKEVELDYKNGNIIAKDSIEELVWYSKKGHYIRAELEDVWNKEGEVELTNIRYQKITSNTAGINDENFADIKTYPNPVNAGEKLIIQSTELNTTFSVDIFNITGKKVSNLTIENGSKANEYQITVPQNLAKGIYFYKVNDKKGNVLQHGKVQVK